jgi:nitrogen regulatory protein PII
MKRLDIIISHEHIAEVNDTLHKNKVGGMTFYDIKGRGHSRSHFLLLLLSTSVSMIYLILV